MRAAIAVLVTFAEFLVGRSPVPVELEPSISLWHDSVFCATAGPTLATPPGHVPPPPPAGPAPCPAAHNITADTRIVGQDLGSLTNSSWSSSPSQGFNDCAAACCANSKCAGITYEQDNEGDGWHHCGAHQPCCWLKSGTIGPWTVRPASNQAKSAIIRDAPSAAGGGPTCSSTVYPSGPTCASAWAASSDSFSSAARQVAGAPSATLNTTTTLLRAPAPAKYAASSPWAGKPIGLQLLVKTVRYSDFPGAIEYTSRIQLAGCAPTHVCDLAEVDWLLPVDPAVQVTLFSQSGSSAAPTDFAPNTPANFVVGCHDQTTPNGGRPSNRQMPAFNLQIGDTGGLVWMIGWSGNWQQDIWRNESGIRIRIASATSSATNAHFCTQMDPGDSYRLARVVALPWNASAGIDKGQADSAAGYNVLRRFLRRHKVPLSDSGQPAGAIFSANNFDRWSVKNQDDNLFLIDQAKRVGLEACQSICTLLCLLHLNPARLTAFVQPSLLFCLLYCLFSARPALIPAVLGFITA